LRNYSNTHADVQAGERRAGLHEHAFEHLVMKLTVRRNEIVCNDKA
jgi:hypothetical protein